MATSSNTHLTPVQQREQTFLSGVFAWLSRNDVRLALLAIVAFVFTFPKSMYPISSGLDSSGGYAMNHAFAYGLVFGKSIVHSYGPLGFAVSPHVMAHNVAWGLLIQFVVKVSLAVGLMRLAQLAKTPEGRPWHSVINGALIIYLLAMCTLEWGLMLSVLSATLIAVGSTQQIKWRWLSAAIVLTVLGGLIKPGFGIVCAAMVGCGAIMASARQQQWQWQPLVYTVLGLSFVLVLWWLLLYHSLDGLLQFMQAVLMAAKGYSAAHTQNPPNNWWLWGAFFISWLVFVRWEKNARVSVFYGVAILATLMYWKYSMVRQDHSLMFFNWLMIFYGALVLYTRVLSWRLIVNVVLTFGLLIASMTASGYNHIKLLGLKQSTQGLGHFMEWVHFNNTASVVHQQTLEALAVDQLSPELKQQLNHKTVDIYPWEASMVAANNLNWQPRPAFQSHMVVGPYFDARNQTVLTDSSKAPDVILWEREHRAGPVGSIDGRYLLNDDPLTLQSLLSQYQLDRIDGNVAVWQKTDTMPIRFESVHEENARWGEWITVPAIEPGSVVVLKVLHHPSLVQKVKRTLYKENESTVEYQLADGSVQTHRLYTDNMHNGVWVNPYVTEINQPLIQGKSVLAVRFNHSPSDWFADRLELDWVIGNPSR